MRCRFFSCFFWLLFWLLSLVSCNSSTDSVSEGDSSVVDGAGADGFDEGAKIYATIASTDEVLVFDEKSRELVSSISVGAGPAILLITPNQEKLYTANWAGNSVSAIQVATEEVTTIDLPNRPYVIAMAPDGKFVYAGLASSELAVIDTESDEVARYFPMSELPASVIVSDDGETIYIAMLHLGTGGIGSIQAVSSSTGEVVHSPIEVGAIPAWITITPDGSTVYALNFFSSDISVVNTERWEVETTITDKVGSAGIIGNVTPDGSKLYVTNHGTGELITVDTESNQIIDTIALDGRPVGVNFNREASRVYVTDFGIGTIEQGTDLAYLLSGVFTLTIDGQISVFETATGELLGSKITTPPGPTSIVVIAP